MEPGDLVRLKQPFRPRLSDSRSFQMGIVVGLNCKTAPLPSPNDEVILHLYDPENSIVYTDEFGVQALFCFHRAELEA